MKINYKSLFPLYVTRTQVIASGPLHGVNLFFHCCHMTCGVARYQEQVMYHLYIYSRQFYLYIRCLGPENTGVLIR